MTQPWGVSLMAETNREKVGVQQARVGGERAEKEESPSGMLHQGYQSPTSSIEPQATHTHIGILISPPFK